MRVPFPFPLWEPRLCIKPDVLRPAPGVQVPSSTLRRSHDYLWRSHRPALRKSFCLYHRVLGETLPAAPETEGRTHSRATDWKAVLDLRSVIPPKGCECCSPAKSTEKAPRLSGTDLGLLQDWEPGPLPQGYTMST